MIAPGVVFGKPFRVCQQMADGDARRVGRRVAEVLELRDILLGGIVERQLARIAKLEDRHRREALGHRRDAKDRVRVDWRLRRDVAHTHRSLVRQLAVDDDAPRGAWCMDRRGVLRQDAIDVRERRRELRAALRVAERRRRRDCLPESNRASSDDKNDRDPLTHWGILHRLRPAQGSGLRQNLRPLTRRSSLSLEP